MKLTVKRTVFNETNTIGELFIDDIFFCYTLEDVVRDIKIKDVTAIPYGTYKVELYHSPHFNKILPHLLNVPNYEGILMHGGNTDKDTEGCILIGHDTDNKIIWNQAADDLVKKLTGLEDIEITIRK